MPFLDPETDTTIYFFDQDKTVNVILEQLKQLHVRMVGTDKLDEFFVTEINIHRENITNVEKCYPNLCSTLKVELRREFNNCMHTLKEFEAAMPPASPP